MKQNPNRYTDIVRSHWSKLDNKSSDAIKHFIRFLQEKMEEGDSDNR